MDKKHVLGQNHEGVKDWSNIPELSLFPCFAQWSFMVLQLRILLWNQHHKRDVYYFFFLISPELSS